MNRFPFVAGTWGIRSQPFSEGYTAGPQKISGLLLVAVNYASNQSQCYVRLPFPHLRDHRRWLQDLLGDAQFDRAGNDLDSRGLCLDVPAWQAHVSQ
jgi:hypothetical protein